ncbi:MAG TPA: HAMP domain-containing sensor histidine kinase [Candidatus Binatia bacterium]|nr:HAMP domain-containing sensor histidine kinase [Candidatus Binatia bacterium]
MAQLAAVLTSPAAARAPGPLARATVSPDEFLADIAHDLRQPLSLIALSAELLIRDRPQNREQHGATLRDAIATMDALIAELLTGDLQPTLNLQPVEPASMVQAVVRQLTPLAARRGLQVRAAAAEALPTIYCDAAKIQRVCFNLLGNAIKFAAQATVIRLESRQVPEGVEFSVTNDGAGIPSGDAPHVFERHWRAPGQVEGHGLGLAIVRKLVNAHGGSVGVHSSAGMTSFCFTLPAAPVPGSGAHAPAGVLPA